MSFKGDVKLCGSMQNMSAIFPDELVKIWKGKALSALRQVFDMVVVVLGNSPQKEEGCPQNRHCR